MKTMDYRSFKECVREQLENFGVYDYHAEHIIQKRNKDFKDLHNKIKKFTPEEVEELKEDYELEGSSIEEELIFQLLIDIAREEKLGAWTDWEYD